LISENTYGNPYTVYSLEIYETSPEKIADVGGKIVSGIKEILARQSS
jgi:hypothetical protein